MLYFWFWRSFPPLSVFSPGYFFYAAASSISILQFCLLIFLMVVMSAFSYSSLHLLFGKLAPTFFPWPTVSLYLLLQEAFLVLTGISALRLLSQISVKNLGEAFFSSPGISNVTWPPTSDKGNTGFSTAHSVHCLSLRVGVHSLVGSEIIL